MLDHKLTRVDDDSPLRCQATHANHQCPYKKVDNSDYCERHGGTHGAFGTNVRNYRLTRVRAEVDRLTNSSSIKSLREEIAIVRLVLQTLLERCSDDFELAINIPQICKMTSDIKDLVVAANKLETTLGMMLDKNAAVEFAEGISAIIGEYVTDEEHMLEIADKLSNLIQTLGTGGRKQLAS